MYSTHNEEKSVVIERFIKTLKVKIYKYTILVSNNLYIDKSNDILNEYNNTYHRTIKIKPIDIKYNACFDFGKEVNDKDPKFQVGDHVKFQNTKTLSPKDILQIGLKKFL